MTNLVHYIENELSPWFSEPFDLMFKNFFDRDSFFLPVLESKPKHPVDIYENENDLTIEIAAIGLDKNDIKIDIEDDNILKVSYDKSKETTESDDCCKYHCRGIAKRSFNFGWRISDGFKIEDAQANMENGLLSIIIPKTEQKPKISKSIEITGISDKKQIKK